MSGPSPADATTLGVLYLAQFAQIGFVGSVVPVALRSHGATLTELASLELLLLLPLLKVLWAPLTDRYGVSRWGHYRSWILVLQPVRVLCLLPLLWLDIGGVSAGLLLVLIASALLASTVDTAVDALALRAAGPTGLVRVNALQIGAGLIGTVVGGGGGLVVLARSGVGVAVVPTLALLLASVVLVARYQEGTGERPTRPSLRATYAAAVSIMSRRRARGWVWLELPFYAVALGSVQATLLPLLVDTGVGAEQMGTLVGLWGPLGGLAGVAGVVALRAHRRPRALVGRAGVLLAVSCAALFAVLGAELGAFVVAAYVVHRGSAGAWSVVSNAVTMELCRLGSIATDYAVVTSWMFAVSFGSGALALWLADTVGYDVVLAGAVVVASLGAFASLLSGVGPRLVFGVDDPPGSPPGDATGSSGRRAGPPERPIVAPWRTGKTWTRRSGWRSTSASPGPGRSGR